MGLDYAIGFGVGLVILGVVFVVGVVINTSLGANSLIASDETAQGIITNVGDTYGNATSLLPILGLVVIAGIVLFVLRSSMGGQAQA
jgi:hypothetical protein